MGGGGVVTGKHYVECSPQTEKCQGSWSTVGSRGRTYICKLTWAVNLRAQSICELVDMEGQHGEF